MAGKDIIVLRVTELRKLRVIQEATSKKITEIAAAVILYITTQIIAYKLNLW